jgi:hypothetical protein
MSGKYSCVRNPKWADKEKASVHCLVKFDAQKVECWYHATHDCGSDILPRCLNGDFGEIADYDGLVPPSKNLSGAWSEVFPNDLIGKKYTPINNIEEFFSEANFENERGTVRGILLVWGAMVENMLDHFVLAKAEQAYKDEKKRFHFVSFSRLIEIVNKHALLDAGFIADLKSIKEIRNCAAHEWRLNLENDEVRKIMPHFEHLRVRYFDELWHPSTELLHISRQFYAPACMALITAMHFRL